MGKRISWLIGIPKILGVGESRYFSPSFSRFTSHRIFITVPVTNKLLIPCRVLDSHFCRLWLFLPLFLALPFPRRFFSQSDSQFSPTDSSSRPPDAGEPSSTQLLRLTPRDSPTHPTLPHPPTFLPPLSWLLSLLGLLPLPFCFCTKADVACTPV